MICPEPTRPVAALPLYKIVVSGKQRMHFRKRLDACGVNERSIYADLAGVGAHLAWKHQHNWLSGYRTPRRTVRLA